MIREKEGVVGDVARLITGSSVAPPIGSIHLQRHVGDIIGFRAADELVMIVTGGVPVNAQASSGADLEGALLYGNHSRVTEHMPTI